MADFLTDDDFKDEPAALTDADFTPTPLPSAADPLRINVGAGAGRGEDDTKAPAEDIFDKRARQKMVDDAGVPIGKGAAAFYGAMGNLGPPVLAGASRIAGALSGNNDVSYADLLKMAEASRTTVAEREPWTYGLSSLAPDALMAIPAARAGKAATTVAGKIGNTLLRNLPGLAWGTAQGAAADGIEGASKGLTSGLLASAHPAIAAGVGTVSGVRTLMDPNLPDGEVIGTAANMLLPLAGKTLQAPRAALKRLAKQYDARGKLASEDVTREASRNLDEQTRTRLAAEGEMETEALTKAGRVKADVDQVLAKAAAEKAAAEGDLSADARTQMREERGVNVEAKRQADVRTKERDSLAKALAVATEKQAGADRSVDAKWAAEHGHAHTRIVEELAKHKAAGGSDADFPYKKQIDYLEAKRSKWFPLLMKELDGIMGDPATWRAEQAERFGGGEAGKNAIAALEADIRSFDAHPFDARAAARKVLDEKRAAAALTPQQVDAIRAKLPAGASMDAEGRVTLPAGNLNADQIAIDKGVETVPMPNEAPYTRDAQLLKDALAREESRLRSRAEPDIRRGLVRAGVSPERSLPFQYFMESLRPLERVTPNAAARYLWAANSGGETPISSALATKEVPVTRGGFPTDEPSRTSYSRPAEAEAVFNALRGMGSGDTLIDRTGRRLSAAAVPGAIGLATDEDEQAQREALERLRAEAEK